MLHNLNPFFDNSATKPSLARQVRAVMPKSIRLATGLLFLGAVTSMLAAVKTWDGKGGPSAGWGNKQNWTDKSVPVDGDSLLFGAPLRTINNNDLTADTMFTGLTFNTGSAEFVLNGNRIKLGGNIINYSTNLQTINLDLNLTANRTINAASGDITISGVISDGGPGLDFGITKDGGGTLTLNGANTYKGGTTLNAGTITMGNGSALGTGPVYLAGGILNANNLSASLGALTLSATSTLNLGTGTGGQLTFQSLSGTSGTLLTINGAGTGNQIFISTAPSAGILGQIQFSGFGIGANWNALTGELTPIPEPIHYALGIFGLVFVSARAGRSYLTRRRPA